MDLPKLIQSTGPLILAAAALGAQAQPIVIDDFSTAQAALNPTQSSFVDGAGIIAGERDIRISGAPTAQIEISGGELSFSNTGTLPAQAVLSWDGNDDDALSLDAVGLAGVDLTQGNNTGFQLTVATARPTQLLITVFSDAANASTVARLLSTSGVFFIGFSELTTSLGAGADLSNVGAITVSIGSGQNSGFTLVDFQTAGPAITISKTDILQNDVDNDNNTDPGDTIRYRITINNNGAPLTAAEIQEMLDLNLDIVPDSLRTTPLARNDYYSAMSDSLLTVPAGSGVLSNDNDPDGGTLTVVAFDAVSVQGGTVNVAADGSLSYTSAAGFGGIDAFNYTARDSDNNDVSAIVTVTVSGPPVIMTSAGALTYNENDPATVIDNGLAVADPDSIELTGATVQITSNCSPGEDLLVFADTATISGNYTAASCTLSLTGSDTPAAYQTALRTVSYENSSDAPGTTERTVSFSASDGMVSSAAATRQITVVALNDPPALDNLEGALLTYLENAAATTVTDTLTVADPDDDNIESATVQISANCNSAEDVLAFASTATIIANYTAASCTLSLTGSDTLANYQTALRAVTYQNSSDDPKTTTRTLAFIVNDGDSDSNQLTRDIDIVAVNDAPSFSCGPDQAVTVPPNTAQTVSAWATGMTAVEAGQALSFNVTGNSDPALFSAGPTFDTISGNLTYTPSGNGGSATITLVLQDNGGTANGGSDISAPPCLFTIQIQSTPAATADSPALTSIPGEEFHTALNTPLDSSLTASAADNLLANDNRGFPLADVVSYGPSANAAAVSVGGGNAATDQGGTVTVSAAGEFIYTPPGATFTGLDQFAYRIQNAVSSSDAVVTVAVGARPACSDDNYTGTVNVPVSVADGVNDILGNDSGDQLLFEQIQGNAFSNGATVNGATNGLNNNPNRVTVFISGAFDQAPAPGVAGANTFSYSVDNGFNDPQSCTVTLTTSDVGGASPWFINNSVSSANFGTFSDPFTSIAAFNSAQGLTNGPADGDVIYLFVGSAYNEADGINLRNSQSLFGGNIAFDSVFTATAGNGAVLPAAYTTFAGSAEGSGSTIATTGGNGIDLAQNNTIGGLNIANTPAGAGIRDNGGTVGTLTISAVSITGTGVGIEANNGGTLAASFTEVSSSNATGIDIAGVDGNFAVAGGTINAGSATAVNINGNPSVALTVVLTGVSSGGGANLGINVSNTSGSFTVNGGTIASKTGTDGSTAAGIGVFLNSTANIALNNMQLNDHQNFAIRGVAVTNFTLNNSTVNGINGNSAAADEGSISFDNLLGSASFTNNNISGGLEDNIVVTNTTGILNRMTVSGGSIGLNSNALGNDGILVESRNNATLNLTVSGVTFVGARGDMVQCNALGTSSMDCVLLDNNFANGHANIVSGGGGNTISGGSASSNISQTYDSSGSTAGAQNYSGAVGSALTVNIVNGQGSTTGLVENNDIGIDGVSGSGSSGGGAGIAVGTNVSVTHTTTLNNNDIRQLFDSLGGIDILANGASTMNATVTNNTVVNLENFAFAALYSVAGGATLTDTASSCLDISGNTLDASAVFGFDIFIDQISPVASYNFPGYIGTANPGASPNALDAFLTGQNTLLTPLIDSTAAQNVTGTGTNCPP